LEIMMRTVFLGTPAIAVPTLQRILADGHQVVGVFTQPDRPAGRGKQMQAPPVKQAALACGLPVYQPTKIRTPEFETLFRTLDPEVAIIVAYGRIIPDKLLAIPRAGFINLHFSLLPAYRGAAPINWALINGEPQTGITTMRIVAELDAGDILLQEVVPIDAAETAVDLATRLSAQGAALLSRTLQQLDAITPRPQNHCQATFAPSLYLMARNTVSNCRSCRRRRYRRRMVATGKNCSSGQKWYSGKLRWGNSSSNSRTAIRRP
jgi:methionyl-tRNA formyltransferase